MSRQTELFYDMVSGVYPMVDIFLQPQKKVLLREISQLPAGRLLDVGVGNGSHLSGYKKHQVVGIDTSSRMLANARKRKSPNIELLQMNGEALAFADESFDYVVLSHVIAVVDDPDRLLREVFRVLKPSGKLFILNHITPANWLAHVDRLFAHLSRLFRFRSKFYINDVQAIEKFTLQNQIVFGALSYFKLLIYAKK